MTAVSNVFIPLPNFIIPQTSDGHDSQDQEIAKFIPLVNMAALSNTPTAAPIAATSSNRKVNGKKGEDNSTTTPLRLSPNTLFPDLLSADAVVKENSNRRNS